MNPQVPKIKCGFILLARKLQESVIMDKPPLYIKLWNWILLQACFKDHGDLRRGQFFTSLRDMQKAMAYKVGYRTVKPTIKEIRGVMKFLTKSSMVVTMKVTHGMIVTVCNYDYYQNMKNYEKHNEGRAKGHTEGTIPRKKGIKKENIYPTDFLLFWDAYPRKVGKGTALKAWNSNSRPSIDAILSAIEKQKKSQQWQEIKFIPHPATWLNGRRWDDEVPEVKKTGWS